MTQAFNLSQFANNVNSAGVAQTGGGGTGTNIASNDLTVNGLTVGKGTGTSTQSTSVGASALSGANTVGYNTAFGYFALKSNTDGANNVSFGNQALQNNTTASQNTAVGSFALTTNTTGANNSALGQNALQGNTTGGNNVAFGVSALSSNTTASNNTAVGYQAGYSKTTGDSNTFLGNVSGYSATTGVQNTFAGYYSGYLITTGSKNAILGSYSGNGGGLDIRTASNYIVLSDGDGNPRGIFNNGGDFLVGCTSTAHTTDGFTIESGGVPYCTRGAAGTLIGFFNKSATIIGSITNSANTATLYNTTSDYRLKENVVPMTGALDKVSRLKPVTYNWKSNGSNGQGFIAHELADVAPECVSGEKDAVDENGKPVYQGIDTSALVGTLTASIQELHEMVKAQALEIATLKAK